MTHGHRGRWGTGIGVLIGCWPFLSLGQPSSPAGSSALNDESVEDLATEETVTIEGAPSARPGQIVLDGREASEIAGVQGDALKALWTLGGVARAPAGSRGVSVWGAAPADTRFYIDDVPVPRLFHLGGSRSILPAHEISSVRLIPGGAHARFGRAIGGAVEVVTTRPGPKVMEVLAHVDPFDVGIKVSGRIQDDSWLSLSSRGSLLSASVDAVGASGLQDVVPIPDYVDYQVRGEHRLPNDDVVTVLALASSDYVQRGIPSLRPEDRFNELSDSWFWRIGASLRRDSHREKRKATLWVGTERNDTNFDYGDVSASEHQQRQSIGVLLTEETEVQGWGTVQLGIDAELAESRFLRTGALTIPSREGDIYVFGQPPGDRVNEDLWSVTSASVGLFANGVLAVGQRFRVEPGVRFEPYVVNGKRVVPTRPSEPDVGYTDLQFAVDPRLRLSFQVTPKLQIFSAGGRYHQPAAPSDLSPVFGSPLLDQAESWQALIGSEFLSDSGFRAELVVFSANQRHLAERSNSATPANANLLTATGRGRSMGAQVSVRAELTDRLHTSLAYTVSRAQRRSEHDSGWRDFDADQTHVMRSTVHWKKDSGLVLGGRFEWSSGMPRTPVVGAVFNASSQRFDPIFGPHNSDRLANFWELSLRAGYEQSRDWGSYRLWLDLVNVTNRVHREEVYYSSDFTTRGFVRGVPIVAAVGAEIRL